MPPTKPVARKASTAAFHGKLLLKGKSDQLVKNASKESSNELETIKDVVKATVDITKTLNCRDPNIPKDGVVFSFKDMCYIPVPEISHMAIHFSMPSVMVLNEEEHDSESENENQELNSPAPPVTPRVEVVLPAILNLTQKQETTQDAEEEAAEESEEKSGKKLANQFNFCERGTLTVHSCNKRDKQVQTEPPPQLEFAANATQWQIYDFYLENNGKKEKLESKPKLTTGEKDLSCLAEVAKIAERAVNQNIFDEIIQDFKHWEDTSDELKRDHGSLLPLWIFSYTGTQSLSVTKVLWNPRYEDMFIATFGSHEFMKDTQSGKVCAYSLSNPLHPEWVFQTECGANDVDFHPIYPNLFVIGLSNGQVAVYDLKRIGKLPVCESNSVSDKHLGPVWQVKWSDDDGEGNLNFYSISEDGTVIHWTMIRDELRSSVLNTIKLDSESAKTKNIGRKLVPPLGSGTAFCFHGHINWLYLIGTDEGTIYQCNKLYGSGTTNVYTAHQHTVNKIHWNTFHPRIFISCSSDQTIKIWDYLLPRPVFTFETGNAVGDVSWAPYSSTAFAAITDDGKVYVFDLNINKFNAICSQHVTPKKSTRLTTISFNAKYPVIIVGDDRGCVRCLKLSPNLRKTAIEGLEATETIQTDEQEIAKLDKCIAVVRDISQIPNNIAYV